MNERAQSFETSRDVFRALRIHAVCAGYAAAAGFLIGVREILKVADLIIERLRK